MRPTIAALCVVLFSCSLAFAAGPPKVFITDSKSWEIGGGVGGSADGFGGAASGGARPQTAEIIKTFGERCPQAAITIKQEKADYIVILDHEGGKSMVARDNKVAVFDNHSGLSIFSHSTAILGNSVKDACQAITRHWAQTGSAEAAAGREPAASPGISPQGARLHLVSSPAGADINVDGDFMGNTPSSIELAAGDHTISVTRAGYKDWSRTVKVTGGEISLNAELEKIPGESGQQ